MAGRSGKRVARRRCRASAHRRGRRGARSLSAAATLHVRPPSGVLANAAPARQTSADRERSDESLRPPCPPAGCDTRVARAGAAALCGLPRRRLATRSGAARGSSPRPAFRRRSVRCAGAAEERGAGAAAEAAADSRSEAANAAQLPTPSASASQRAARQARAEREHRRIDERQQRPAAMRCPDPGGHAPPTRSSKRRTPAAPPLRAPPFRRRGERCAGAARERGAGVPRRARISDGPERAPFRGFEGQVLEMRYTYIGKAMTVVFVSIGGWKQTASSLEAGLALAVQAPCYSRG